MRERRLRQVLFLIACALCIALLFRIMRKLPKERSHDGWMIGIHHILFAQAVKTVAPVMAVEKGMEEGCLEKAFLYVTAPVIPYMAERDAWSLAENAERTNVEKLAGDEKMQGENYGADNGVNERTTKRDEGITNDGTASGDENLETGWNVENLANDGITSENGKYADEALHQVDEDFEDDGVSGMEDAGDWMESVMTPKSRLTDKKQILDEATMNSFEALVKQFYVVDSTTMADGSLLNAERFLAKDLRIDQTGDGPQILIYHTHSQEGYADKDHPLATVVGVGRELTRVLEEDYGYRVLHHEGIYDKPSRNGAYSRALPEVERILKENPSIQVVIDLHRDEMPENVRLITEVDGKKAARFMFFNGISRTRKTGVLDYLENQWLEENLAFSFQMEKAAQEYYPGLTRKIYLKGYRYNMHVCPKTLLIELGAQNNTYEEALAACGPLASLLDHVLSGGECLGAAIP